MKHVGSHTSRTYVLDVFIDTPPPSVRAEEQAWLYVTRRRADGSTLRTSIGFGVSGLSAIIALLQSAQITGDGE